MNAALAINDLSISSELDRKAMIDILGGGGWELYDRYKKCVGYKRKHGQKYKVYKCFEKYVKYKTKCYYKCVPVYSCDYKY